MNPVVLMQVLFKVTSMTLTEARDQNLIDTALMHKLAHRMDELLAAALTGSAVIYDKDHVEIMTQEEGLKWLKEHQGKDVEIVSDDEEYKSVVGKKVLKIGDDL